MKAWAALALAALLIVSSGSFRAPLANETMVGASSTGSISYGGATLVGINASDGARIEVFTISGFYVVIVEANASLAPLTLSVSSFEGAYAPLVRLCSNASPANATLAGVWDGGDYVSLPGLSTIVSYSRSSGCAAAITIDGQDPEFEPLTSFTPSSWVGFVLAGRGWWAEVVVGTLGGSSGAGPSASLPPPTITGPGAGPRGLAGAEALASRDAFSILLLISAASLALAAVAERAKRGGQEGHRGPEGGRASNDLRLRVAGVRGGPCISRVRRDA